MPMKVLLTVTAFILFTEGRGFIYWLEKHLWACPFKNLTGIDCPGCGLQRSFVALLKGDVLVSIKLYPPTLVLLALVLFTLMHLKFEFKSGALIIKALYICATAIIIINYIYKVYYQQLF